MNGPRVLVLGAGGMLGHKMFQASSARFADSWCTLRGALADYPVSGVPAFASPNVIEGCDAMDVRVVHDLVQRVRPDVVVNCVGVIKQRPLAHDAIPSLTLNALLPHHLARALSEWDGRLIQISTDCVFDGTRGGRNEDDLTDAPDLYGRSKALGEVSAGNAVTLRTSMIGRELRSHVSLLDWLIARDGSTVKGFTRVWWSGVTSNHLADLIVSIIADHPSLRGLYHVSSSRISKYELLHLLRDAYRLKIEIEPDDQMVLDRSLDGRRLAAAIGYRVPAWPDLLAQLVSDPTPYDIGN